ncbi:MAG: hypothetical protein RBS17_04435 [Coriobacteriia bacterium]|nr:hypothetical protein [Coriobacteriia bacterium]
MTDTIAHSGGRDIRGASRGARVLVSGIVLLSVLMLGGCASDEQQRADIRESLEGPSLAVFELAEAAEAGDITGVRTYMDSSSVGVVFARETLARLDDDDDSEASTPAAGGHSGDFDPSAMERTFAERFVEEFLAGVTDGTVVAEGTLFSEILTAGPGEAESLSDDEVLVSVVMPADEDGQTEIVRLRMSRTGQRWMLVAIEDTTDLYGLFF